MTATVKLCQDLAQLRPSFQEATAKTRRNFFYSRQARVYDAWAETTGRAAEKIAGGDRAGGVFTLVAGLLGALDTSAKNAAERGWLKRNFEHGLTPASEFQAYHDKAFANNKGPLECGLCCGNGNDRPCAEKRIKDQGPAHVKKEAGMAITAPALACA